MRTLLLSILLLIVAAPAAAQAATIRIEQQGPGGEPITGGCYEAVNEIEAVSACDDATDADPGVILLNNLPPGTYDVEEFREPEGYYPTADFTVTLSSADEVDRRVRRHDARPVLRIVTTDAGGKAMPGSCWFVRIPGDPEGGWDECDRDDGAEDGVTRFLDMDANDYELIHRSAPAGIDRIDRTPFTMPATEDKTLTFALEPAVAPVNTVAPAVTGGHRAGDELTGTLGTWTGSAEILYNDAWERCELDGTFCQSVEDYDETYTVKAEDAGKALRYRVTAANDGGRDSAWSALHAITSLETPEPTTGPAVTGSTRVGQVLTADPGEWTNTPTFSYQWQRCAAECTDVANATAATYRSTNADAKQRLRVVVTARNSAGERSATSAQTEPINDGPYNRVRPSTTGTPAAHNEMEAYPGSWGTSHAPIEFTYVWLRCGLDGTTGCMPVGEGDVYRVSQQDEGHTILVEVTATDAGGSATARSNPRTVLTQRPLPTVRPWVTGIAKLEQRLTAHTGTWSPAPRRIDYYWERCNRDGCAKVDGSDGDRTYKIDEDDLGYSLRIVVWATGTEGRGFAVSDPSAVVHRYPPTNLRRPTVSGTARVGMRLTGEPGEWSEPHDRPLDFYWYRCEADDLEGKHCKQIHDPAEFGRRYTVRREDAGYRIKFIVVAANDGVVTGASAELTDVVPLNPPVNTVAPKITGLQRLGETLTANRGTWTADREIELRHWWTRCDADGEHCQTVDGSENDRTYKVGRADLGFTLKLRVRAETEEGVAEAWSERTSKITEQPPKPLANPSISGTPRVDRTLTADLGVWTSAWNVRFNVRWYRCEANGTGCVAIQDADDRTYRLRYSDIDHRIKAQVTAVSDEGNGSAWSDATAVIMR